MIRYLGICYLIMVVCTVAVLKRSKPCVNGELENDLCFCRDGWTGASCHRRMNCDGFEREPNGSCVECQEGWTGVDCDAIDCNGHGTPNYDLTSCHCEKPYSGQFCETFQTKDIYSYYNKIVSQTGAIGVLTCIPLFLIYLVCDRFAKKRQRVRLEKHLVGTMVLTNPENRGAINREVISHLLYKD
uniref:EGF-like domain-containing protein n=1 Tax=Haemonchus contortus TaxID=6289 RepID=A0A7I4YBI2_HAECO|nr:Protein F40A3.2 [Haemonchus contortus]CDJ94416.1 tenascin-like [Haemonchus contortus]